MLRARRIVGWFLAAAVACFFAALLSANLYVQSQATQERIQQELSQRLAMPLHIQRISVTPWGGLQLSGITIRQRDVTTPFLQASSLSLRVRLRSIFRRPLIIKEVALIEPHVIWTQNESGKWRVPSADRDGAAPVPTSRGLTSESAPVATPATPASRRELPVPESEIKRVKLVGGSFHFLDRQNQDVALFDGVEFSSSMRDVNSLHGETRVAKISLRDRVFLSNLRADLRYDPTALELSNVQARAARGELEGDFSMQPQVENSPFAVHANFRRVQADELVAEAGGSKETVRGVLEGTLEATGKIADPNALTGTGSIALQGGHVQQFVLLAAIGQVLQIEELTQLDLEQAEAKYRLAGSGVVIDQLVLRSPNLGLTATGSVTLNGKVALDSTLTINDKIRGQLFRGMRENFTATDRPGEYSLPFHIGGTLEKPKTDLMERAVGANLKNIGGVIDALLGRGKTRKKRDAAASPASSPSATVRPIESPTPELSSPFAIPPTPTP